MGVLGRLKRLVNSKLTRWDHAVIHEDSIPSFHLLVSLLEGAGMQPQTVFDIGVAYGTPWLYEAFPQAAFHLVDPTRESLPHMRSIAQKLKAEIHPFGLGEEEGSLSIAVRPDIGGSTLFEEVGVCEISARYEVPIKRFDQVFDSFCRPALCKIDVQGAERMVLAGMGERLAWLDVLIVETSLIATLHGDTPEFGDIVAFLGARGFVLYDLIGFHRRPLDRALTQIDAVFVPESSPLRADRRWQASL